MKINGEPYIIELFPLSTFHELRLRTVTHIAANSDCYFIELTLFCQFNIDNAL